MCVCVFFLCLLLELYLLITSRYMISVFDKTGSSSFLWGIRHDKTNCKNNTLCFVFIEIPLAMVNEMMFFAKHTLAIPYRYNSIRLTIFLSSQLGIQQLRFLYAVSTGTYIQLILHMRARRIGSIPGKWPVDIRANGPLFCININKTMLLSSNNATNYRPLLLLCGYFTV